MADTERAGFWRVNNPIMWACLVTAGFIGLIIWFGLAETCNADLFPKGDCPPKWRHLQVAPPNEVGDTLAGLAGVLAFIWLIATVLLQSVELGEQRRVLALQREEMEEQRKATQDMARSMSAQAKIFEGEQEQRMQDRAELLFNEHLRSLILMIRESGSHGLVWHFSNGPFDENCDHHERIYSHSLSSKIDGTGLIEEVVFEFRAKLKDMGEDLDDGLSQFLFNCIPQRTDVIPKIELEIEKILSMRAELSKSQKRRLDRMKFDEIKSYLNELNRTPHYWEENDA